MKKRRICQERLSLHADQGCTLNKIALSKKELDDYR